MPVTTDLEELVDGLYDEYARAHLKKGRDNFFRSSRGYVFEYGKPVYERRKEFDPRFIFAKKGPVELRYTDNGTWQDSNGTVFALYNDTAIADPDIRCGVGWASFPKSHHLTPYCAPHDYTYSSRTYQIYHTRKEADEYLRYLLSHSLTPWVAHPFYYIVRIFGAFLPSAKNWGKIPVGKITGEFLTDNLKHNRSI